MPFTTCPFLLNLSMILTANSSPFSLLLHFQTTLDIPLYFSNNVKKIIFFDIFKEKQVENPQLLQHIELNELLRKFVCKQTQIFRNFIHRKLLYVSTNFYKQPEYYNFIVLLIIVYYKG